MRPLLVLALALFLCGILPALAMCLVGAWVMGVIP